jgi:hypothetical protein
MFFTLPLRQIYVYHTEAGHWKQYRERSTFRVLCGFIKGGGRGTESREQGEVVDEGEPRTLTERTLLATWSAPPAAGVNRTAGVAAPALLAQAAGAHGHLPLPRGAVLSPPALLSESARRVARA